MMSQWDRGKWCTIVAAQLHNSFGLQLSLCAYWKEQSSDLLNTPRRINVCYLNTVTTSTNEFFCGASLTYWVNESISRRLIHSYCTCDCTKNRWCGWPADTSWYLTFLILACDPLHGCQLDCWLCGIQNGNLKKKLAKIYMCSMSEFFWMDFSHFFVITNTSSNCCAVTFH